MLAKSQTAPGSQGNLAISSGHPPPQNTHSPGAPAWIHYLSTAGVRNRRTGQLQPLGPQCPEGLSGCCPRSGLSICLKQEEYSPSTSCFRIRLDLERSLSGATEGGTHFLPQVFHSKAFQWDLWVSGHHETTGRQRWFDCGSFFGLEIVHHLLHGLYHLLPPWMSLGIPKRPH